MLIGSFMLTSGAAPQFRISSSVILPAIIFLAAFFLFVVAKALLIQRKKITTGDKGLVGEIGTAISNIEKEGLVRVHGEIWKAFSDEFVGKGEKIEVVDVNGMTLFVRKIKEV